MTATVGAPPRAASPAVRRPDPGAAVAALAVRQIRRGTLVVVTVTAGLSALVAVQYRSVVAGPLDVAAVQSLAANPAIRTLFGEPVGLDTAGGFTVWRTGTFLAVLVGVWALTTGTRVTRGEEVAGRWASLLAGPVRLPALVAVHLGVLVGAQVLVGAAVAGGLVLAGAAPTGSLLYGGALALVGVVLAAVGVLAAQVAADRRTATTAAAGLLVAWLLVRMVADGVAALGWAMWLSPFGLLAETAPYAGDRPLPLVVLGTTGLVVGAAAVAAAAHRDVGAGLAPSPGARAARLGLLGSVAGFAVRRTLPTGGAWALGLAAYFLLIGLLAVSMTEFLAANPAFGDAAAAAGFAELSSVAGYAAALLGLLPVPVGVFAATRLAAAAGDEADGRLTLLLTGPVSRTRWAWTEAAVAAAGCTALTVLAGVALWAGTRVVGAPLGVGDAVAGALNGLPVALLCVGAALAALGWAPRVVLPLGSLPAAGGFLLQVLADSLAWPGWVRALSPYDHLAAVPVEPVDVTGAVGLVAVAGALGVLGVLGTGRRDLRG